MSKCSSIFLSDKYSMCFSHVIMGTGTSSTKSFEIEHGGGKEKNSKVLVFLHRTWAVILTSKTRTLTRLKKRNQDKDTCSDYTSQYSQYSFCSCSQCQKDDGFSSAGFR